MVPIPYLIAPISLPAQPPAEEATLARRETFEGGLVVEYEGVATTDFAKNVTRFEGKVVATYDQTRVEAPLLEIDSANKKGVADRGVLLVDPEGTIEARRVEFDWANRTGLATDVVVEAGNMRVWATSLSIQPERWELSDARLTLSRAKKPEYFLTTPRVVLHPGKNGLAEHVGVQIGGLKLGSIPKIPWSLDPRVSGFQMPSISERKGVGFGASWTSEFLLGDRSAIRGAIGSFPGKPPDYVFVLSHSPLEPETALGPVQPRGDLGERFNDGWFENIDVAAPESERKAVSRKRVNYSLGTYWNISSGGRLEQPEHIAKEFEAVGEWGGNFGPVAGYLNARVQRIRLDARDPFVDRTLVQGALLSPEWGLAPKLAMQARADLFGTVSQDNRYGWARGRLGLVYRPFEGLAFGAAFSSTLQFGTPDFLIDRPYAEQVVHLRADYSKGPYTARYLAKFDTRRSLWYDQEYELAVVWQSFEPFVVVREQPSDFRFGLRFRIDNVLERLQQRSQNRELVQRD